MLRIRFIIGTVLTAATACVARPGTLDRSLVPGAQWNAVLDPGVGNSLRGSITFVRLDPPGQTRAIISLAGGAPGAILPWHVHYGRCGDDGVIVGSPGSYPPLVLGTTGSLDAVAQLPIELADRTPYFLHVHASPSDMKTVAGCAALVPDRGIAAVTNVPR
jgi:hypothetical protein